MSCVLIHSMHEFGIDPDMGQGYVHEVL